eukprot:TRINITY_DN8489_c0_g2_i13.p1 TRINITY_DN8489_c0_g2~~TRINITY_DN8489_c0_g2_i13.p1  ORF type:complete len:340 (-),score=58.45 TRINITY_DN8489_c0_g2_i13:295-1314(-)
MIIIKKVCQATCVNTQNSQEEEYGLNCDSQLEVRQEISGSVNEKNKDKQLLMQVETETLSQDTNNKRKRDETMQGMVNSEGQLSLSLQQQLLLQKQCNYDKQGQEVLELDQKRQRVELKETEQLGPICAVGTTQVLTSEGQNLQQNYGSNVDLQLIAHNDNNEQTQIEKSRKLSYEMNPKNCQLKFVDDENVDRLPSQERRNQLQLKQSVKQCQKRQQQFEVEDQSLILVNQNLENQAGKQEKNQNIRSADNEVKIDEDQLKGNSDPPKQNSQDFVQDVEQDNCSNQNKQVGMQDGAFVKDLQQGETSQLEQTSCLERKNSLELQIQSEDVEEFEQFEG